MDPRLHRFVRNVAPLGARVLLLALSSGCFFESATLSAPDKVTTQAQSVALATNPPMTGGLSEASLNLQVNSYACVNNQVLSAFQVTNSGTVAVRLSDISIKFWANDTTAQNMVGGVNYGGCLTNAMGCFHQVTGVAASAASLPAACGPDPNHMANWEITVSTTDPTMLSPGAVWNGVQTTAHLANYGTFSPGTSTWYSQCVSPSGTWVTDSHYAVYYQGKLVYASGLNAPGCRAPQGSQPLTGYVTSEIASRPLLGRVPSTTTIHLAVSLPVRNASALKQFIADVSNPANPATYRHYLSPEQYTAGYGPLASDYAKLKTWATSRGLTISKSYPNNVLLDVRGPASAVEKALYVNLVHRQRVDGTQFYAPDREPSIDLDTSVLRISQLENIFVPMALIDQSTASLLGPTDYRGAYASCHSELDGSGQSIGIFSYAAFSESDVQAYQTAAGIPPDQFATVTAVPINGFSTTPVSGDPLVEADLDVEMALSMAPRAHIYVFEAAAELTPTNSVLNTMATTTPLILQLSSSWGMARDLATQQIIDQFAAQGQSFFLHSSDSGAFSSTVSPLFDINLSNVTIVGGTDPNIVTDDEGVYRLDGEKGWDGSGGGVLPSVAIPTYQPSVATTNFTPSLFYPEGPSALAHRMLPDIAAFASNIDCYADGVMRRVGGTSASTPLWAGFMALVNQRNAEQALAPVGFVNPALYHIGTSTAFEDNFNDIQEGSNPNSGFGTPGVPTYYAVKGYDMVTGWGSPRCELITTLSTPCTSSDSDPNNCGACWHSCQGGECVAGVCQPVALTPGHYAFVPVGVHQLVATADRLFATGTLQLSHAENQGLLESITLNGTDYLTWLEGSGATGVTADSEAAYWLVDHTIHKVDLATNLDTAMNISGRALAIDPSFVYVNGYDDSKLAYVASSELVIPIATGVAHPGVVLLSNVGLSERTVVFVSSADADDAPSSGSISTIQWLGGEENTLATGQDHPADLATDDTYIYWSNLGNATSKRISINRVPVTGGTSAELTSFAWDQSGGGWGSIAVDDSSVYYVDGEAGNLMKMAKDGSTKTVLLAETGVVLGIAVDSKSVYWLRANGVIKKLAK